MPEPQYTVAYHGIPRPVLTQALNSGLWVTPRKRGSVFRSVKGDFDRCDNIRGFPCRGHLCLHHDPEAALYHGTVLEIDLTDIPYVLIWNHVTVGPDAGKDFPGEMYVHQDIKPARLRLLDPQPEYTETTHLYGLTDSYIRGKLGLPPRNPDLEPAQISPMEMLALKMLGVRAPDFKTDSTRAAIHKGRQKKAQRKGRQKARRRR